jgi:hypothetical protein
MWRRLLPRGEPVRDGHARTDVLSGGAGVPERQGNRVLHRGAEVHGAGVPMRSWLFCASLAVLLSCGARSGLGVDGAGGAAEGGRDAPAVPAVQLGLGQNYSCLRRNGSIACWGENDSGELGDGTTVLRSTPVSVVGITDAVDLSPGYGTACALLADRTVRCWGYDNFGEVGDGVWMPNPDPCFLILRLSPVEVVGLRGVVSLVGGNFPDGDCAVLSDGTVHCWGGVRCLGQVGQPGPTELPMLAGATEIMMGGVLCARWGQGPVECCGEDIDGDLGLGKIEVPPPDYLGVDHSMLTPVDGLSNVVRLASGDLNNCAELPDESWVCWGSNQYGQLGDGTTMDQPAPVPVKGLPPGALVRLGVAHSCALLPDETVSCWGNNDYGQLGDGTNTPHLTPAPVPGLTDVVDLALGNGHACARTRVGRIYCWGDNKYGQIGDGTTIDRSVPTEVFFP